MYRLVLIYVQRLCLFKLLHWLHLFFLNYDFKKYLNDIRPFSLIKDYILPYLTLFGLVQYYDAETLHRYVGFENFLNLPPHNI